MRTLIAQPQTAVLLYSAPEHRERPAGDLHQTGCPCSRTRPGVGDRPAETSSSSPPPLVGDEQVTTRTPGLLDGNEFLEGLTVDIDLRWTSSPRSPPESCRRRDRPEMAREDTATGAANGR